ncbi:hypothetical protein KC799_03960, partial [candidate division KSB1 bacterium]|nr:hypothetical protein [candidate division KSB1 bacterium]
EGPEFERGIGRFDTLTLLNAGMLNVRFIHFSTSSTEPRLGRGYPLPIANYWRCINQAELVYFNESIKKATPCVHVFVVFL